ncbi:lycopene cyclase family protein [Lujinxingia litoralis]|nr:lycopene cyclase family protein [Lujinxingia litoralis]
MTSPHPIIVVGAGPAGLWLSTLLARRGLAVVVVDPDPLAPWPNTYGIWSDALQHLELPVPAEATFKAAAIHLPGRDAQRLPRAYTRVDPRAFKTLLIDQLTAHGGTLHTGRASTASPGRDAHTAAWLTLESGESLAASALIDATGQGLLRQSGSAPTAPGYQSALGWLARFERDPLQGQPLTLMDFRPPPVDDARDIPTFLYGMHLGDDLYFVEETALVTRQPLTYDALEARLRARLAARHALPTRVLEVERCLIPMGTALPPPPRADQAPIIAFGAAAGFVHPATGYSLARSLREAAPLADLLQNALSAERPAHTTALQARALLWSARDRRARALYTLGQESVMAMDLDTIAHFFESFFLLPDEDWHAYMAATLTPAEVAALMWKLFGKSPNSLRLHLAREALRVAPTTLQKLLTPTRATVEGGAP